MTSKELEKINKLHKEINELEDFLKNDHFPRRLFIDYSLYVEIPFLTGYVFSRYDPSEELKLKINEVAEEYLKELKRKLEEF